MFPCFNIILTVLFYCEIGNLKTTAQTFEISTTDRPQSEALTNIYGKIGEYNYRFTEIEKQITEMRNTLENKQKLIDGLKNELKISNEKIALFEKTIAKVQDFDWPRNCKEIMQKGNHVSGVYFVRPKTKIMAVFCDMNTEGGEWTVFQKRFDGSQDFFLFWNDYKNGFGSFSGEFWLGLDNLHEMTSAYSNELLIEVTDFDQKTVYAKYETFSIGSEEEDYVLKSLGNYTGNAGDSLSYQKNMKFSTRDRDNDKDVTKSCAKRYTGAWWYNICLHSNLNGRYLEKQLVGTDDNSAIVWVAFRGGLYGLKASRMMIRPR